MAARWVWHAIRVSRWFKVGHCLVSKCGMMRLSTGLGVEVNCTDYRELVTSPTRTTFSEYGHPPQVFSQGFSLSSTQCYPTAGLAVEFSLLFCIAVAWVGWSVFKWACNPFSPWAPSVSPWLGLFVP